MHQRCTNSMFHTLPKTFCPMSTRLEHMSLAFGRVSPKALHCTLARATRSQCGCRLQRSVWAKAKLDTRQQQVRTDTGELQALRSYQVPVPLLMPCKLVQELVREARSMQVGCPPWGLVPTQK